MEVSMTRIIVGGIEIDVKPGTTLVYNGDTDILHIGPTNKPLLRPTLPPEVHVSKSGKPAPDIVKKVIKTLDKEIGLLDEEIKFLDKDKETIEFKPIYKTELTRRIIELVSRSESPVAGMFITMQCLGKNSQPKKQRYLKMLIEELVSKGKLIAIKENNRARYSVPT
jgi:hypothetical protein